MDQSYMDADVAFFIKSEEENYNTQIEQTKKRVSKFEQDLEEMKQKVDQKAQEVSEEENTYKSKLEKINVIDTKTKELERTIESKPMKEQEVILIRAMIEERNRLKKESKELKKECKEKKLNLDMELEKVKKHNEELVKKEHAEILKKIDDKYEAEYSKLFERRKKIAEQNRSITVLQRKIENCPSKIELQQYHKWFTELFESINQKFEENKRYVSVYNTKETVKQLMY